GPAGQRRVGRDDFFRSAGHQVVVELLALGVHGVSAVREASEVKADGGRHIHEEPVAPTTDDEREILVSELGARAVRVPVPDSYGPANQIETAEPLAAPVEVVLGIEQQGVDDAANAARRIVRQALDLEARLRAESVAREVRVVLDLVSQEPAVARPERELPGI